MRHRTICQSVDDQFDRAGQATNRVEIAGIVDQRCMDEAKQSDVFAPARWHGTQVFGQAPSRIKRRTGGDHMHAAQQRLEPRERGHRPERVDHVQQLRNVGFSRNHVCQIACIKIASAQPCFHIRVRFVDQGCIWVGVPCGPEQSLIGRDNARAKADGGVILYLSHYQHFGPVRQIGYGTSKVILAQRALRHGLHQSFRTQGLIGAHTAPLLDQLFQPAGAAWVIVNAQIISDQRQGRDQFCTQAARPQEAILYADCALMPDICLARPNHPGLARGACLGRIILKDQRFVAAKDLL
mmetsp:Transcript_22601/g.36916  ORF Transcript_22601/g.36916 Transcript_22601/m.36916 type:complete len:296 (+) Transcript_22601:3411-4298(+)